MSFGALLILPLIGGYAFSTIWSPSYYHASRESGHRLYFRAGFYAIVMFGAATAVHVVAFVHSDLYRELLRIESAVIHATLAVGTVNIWGVEARFSILMLSALLGPAMGHALNFPQHYLKLSAAHPWLPYAQLFERWELWVLSRAAANNDFEKLVLRSFTRRIPLLITLVSNKVYVGWAIRAPDPVATSRYLRLLPLLSGYRDKDSQNVHFTTHYFHVLSPPTLGLEEIDHLEPGDFEVVVPVQQITNAHLFDLDAHERLPSELPDKHPTIAQLFHWSP
ncbi:MAG: hypothetical protein AB7Q01_08180 [Gammaproteobacteria bacterium]